LSKHSVQRKVDSDNYVIIFTRDIHSGLDDMPERAGSKYNSRQIEEA
jgi:hypothetical protein